MSGTRKPPRRPQSRFAQERYVAERNAWMYRHPRATPREYQQAIALIAKRLGL